MGLISLHHLNEQHSLVMVIILLQKMGVDKQTSKRDNLLDNDNYDQLCHYKKKKQ